MEPLNPFLTLSAAIERGGNKNLKIYEYTKDQTLKPEEAYYCYTEGSAKVLGLKYGSLSPGMEANFLVLDKDPLTTNPEKIKIIGIYLKGKWILNPNL